MKKITQDQLDLLLKQAHLKTRLRRLLHMPSEDTPWEAYDFLPLWSKSGNEGVILLESSRLGSTSNWVLHILPFTLNYRLVDTATGRSKPVTCDFCFTWQAGGHGARISFATTPGSTRGFLCCADLRCSLHVRDKTAAALLSRSQLKEDMTPAQRITRLQQRLAWLSLELESRPIGYN